MKIHPAVLLLACLMLVIAVGPWLAPQSPVAQDRLLGVSPPATGHWLGTDTYGRDVLSRFLAGGGWSLLVGLAGTLLVMLLAIAAGGIAGWRHGGSLDRWVMRAGDVALSVPWLYALIGLRAALPLEMKPRTTTAVLLLVIAVVSWARPARLIRGAVAAQMTRGYVDAARGFGVPPWRIFRDHVLGAVSGIVAAQALTLLPRFVLAEVTLAFLGIASGGAEPSWGEMLLPLKEPYLLAQQWWRVLPVVLMLPLFVVLTLAARVAVRHSRAGR